MAVARCERRHQDRRAETVLAIPFRRLEVYLMTSDPKGRAIVRANNEKSIIARSDP
jgi:hypothetical protein